MSFWIRGDDGLLRCGDAALTLAGFRQRYPEAPEFTLQIQHARGDFVEQDSEVRTD